MPWSTIDFAEDIDNSALMSKKLYTDVANNHAPIKFAVVKGVKIPWVTAKLLEAKEIDITIFRKQDYPIAPTIGECSKSCVTLQITKSVV